MCSSDLDAKGDDRTNRLIELGHNQMNEGNDDASFNNEQATGRNDKPVSFTLGGDDEPLMLPELRPRHRGGKRHSTSAEGTEFDKTVTSGPNDAVETENKDTARQNYEGFPVSDGSARGDNPPENGRLDESPGTLRTSAPVTPDTTRNQVLNKSSLYRQSSGQSDGSDRKSVV